MKLYSPELLLFYVPCPDKQTAQELGRQAVELRLAACANIGEGISSVYEWQGSMESSEECPLLLKTNPYKSLALQNWLEENHPYDCPCITHWPIAANASFVAWVKEQTS